MRSRGSRHGRLGLAARDDSAECARIDFFVVAKPLLALKEARVTGQPRNFHFLGICGTAMGSVAAALRERGFTVTGSDENVYPPMSTFLEKRGVTLNPVIARRIFRRTPT